jgi:UDP-N-acetylglucosamine/UDP-N-acetylgalactosamine diphosphorylase
VAKGKLNQKFNPAIIGEGLNLKAKSRVKSDRTARIEKIINKGVKIANPAATEIGPEVDIDRISGDGVVIYTGCKIFGENTLILPGVKLGYEAPVTVDDCQIGPDVELKGGYFNQAVFLDNAKCGLGSHVRGATVLEEQASIAHTVALKHTILLPFVTLGSLINFCDCLMAGGTSRKDHSEVGSSYIHFNFTPNQDKATASLIGDVPRGVMLNQRPIFLGGQGGLVGPCRLGFGITVAAGTIIRKDEPRSNRLIFGGAGKGGNVPYAPGNFLTGKKIIINNIIYIANLIALTHWYQKVRRLFVAKRFPEALLNGLNEKMNLAVAERINRLEVVCLKKSDGGWSELKGLLNDQLADPGDAKSMDTFLESIHKGIAARGKDYIGVIQGLEPADSDSGTRWLQGIVDHIAAEAVRVMPALSGDRI